MSAITKKIIAITITFLFFLQCNLSTQTTQAVGREINADYLGVSPGRFNSIKVTDIDKDRRMEILFGNNNGYINSIEYKDGSYIDEWQSPKIGTRAWGLEIGDPDNDGKDEVIAGDGDGYLYVMNYSSNKIEWRSKFIGRDVDGIKVGDIDNDGNDEIVAGTGYKTDFPAGKLSVFRYNKMAKNVNDVFLPVKTFGLNGEIGFNESKHRGVAIADTDLDGQIEIIVSSGVAQGERPGQGYLRIVDGKTGHHEWTSEDLNGDAEGVLAADIDSDGVPEIVTGTGYRYQEGYVLIFKWDNKTHAYHNVWKSDNVGPKAYGLAAGDIDNDGVKEIVTGNQPGYIRVFNGVTHELKWKSRLLSNDVLGICLEDVNGDGTIEIVAAQGGYDGKGDFTSAYTAPHIYIINGMTYEIQTVLGEIDYVALAFQVTIVLLLIILLLAIKHYTNIRRKAKNADTERGDVRR